MARHNCDSVCSRLAAARNVCSTYPSLIRERYWPYLDCITQSAFRQKDVILGCSSFQGSRCVCMCVCACVCVCMFAVCVRVCSVCVL